MSEAMRNTICERATKVLNERKEYQLFGSIYVYVKDPLPQCVNLTSVLQQVEDIIPHHLTDEVDTIYVGEFPELVSREVKAVFKDATIYITNQQDSDEEMIDDIIHEFAHSIEVFAGMEIYSDGFLEREFVQKRKKVLDILYKEGYNVSVVNFLDTEYSRELDYFLYKGIGYDKLSLLTLDIFPTPYSITSLREYFAVGFEEYLYGDRKQLGIVSPTLYGKIEAIINV